MGCCCFLEWVVGYTVCKVVVAVVVACEDAAVYVYKTDNCLLSAVFVALLPQGVKRSAMMTGAASTSSVSTDSAQNAPS